KPQSCSGGLPPGPPFRGVLTPPRPPNKSLSGTHPTGFETELRQPWLRSGYHPTTAPSQHHCTAPVVPSGGGVGDAAVPHIWGVWGAATQAANLVLSQGLTVGQRETKTAKKLPIAAFM
ncbi:MAG: hypothetical protein NW220_16165, partial [Leptolyngbyaceae cyanobacterium bins.349]|nr:hypothetical protein [Leptolyngbyaceae cyanobacterium bins.349]